MGEGTLRRQIHSRAPDLTDEIESLVDKWLRPLLNKLTIGTTIDYRPKQIHDPVWGAIDVHPWEVAILDTPLMQRMRGVRQLGLAQLVFPGANHGRLEHMLGVVGAIEQVIQALERQVARWNNNNPDTTIPVIEEHARYAIRLAGLLHDVGHGPFSHALEPVLEVDAPLGEAGPADRPWREQLQVVRRLLTSQYALNKLPSASETLTVMIVLSEAMKKVFASDKIIMRRGYSAEALQETIVAAVIGALDGPGATHLSGLVSSQVDADKLDYLSRDAYHAGLEIGFDTDRLKGKLEVLRLREENLPEAATQELRERAKRSKEGTFLQLGIAASGFGSFEQMLIGRTFLYDRVYHHHKVRAAEAMAQRLMLVTERDRKRRFSLSEVFLSVDDETLLRIFAGDVSHPDLEVTSPAAANLARGILDRNLLHRAFAFRGRFISVAPGLDSDTADQTQNALWGQIVKDLDGLKPRYDLGEEIYQLAVRAAGVLRDADVDREEMEQFGESLAQVGPEQIIVDLPSSKAEAIRILARYPNGAIRIPEFSFNPVKWADAYDLQKRTGYVFCPREVAPLIGVASKIVFLLRYGVTMIGEADGYIKARPAPSEWLEALSKAGLIDERAVELLTSRRHSLMAIREQHLKLPKAWIKEDVDLAAKLSNDLNKNLRGGLTPDDLDALGRVLEAMYRFVDTWFQSDRVTADLESEKALQNVIREAFTMSGLKVHEKSKMNGGELDLWVENAVLVENKFHASVTDPERIAPAAGMQGRRYAVSLGSQIVIVVSAYRVAAGRFPQKSATVSVGPIVSADGNRVEIRFNLPYGAPVPSREVTE